MLPPSPGSPSHVSGTVSGLTGQGLVLQNGGGGDVAVDADGSFAFTSPVAMGGGFDVTVARQPTNPWQTCTVAGGTGSADGSAEASVAVSCRTNEYTIGGTVDRICAAFVLRNNGEDIVVDSSSPTFTFPTPVASGQPYDVTVVSLVDTSLRGVCGCFVASGGGGIVTSGPVTSVVTSCNIP